MIDKNLIRDTIQFGSINYSTKAPFGRPERIASEINLKSRLLMDIIARGRWVIEKEQEIDDKLELIDKSIMGKR